MLWTHRVFDDSITAVFSYVRELYAVCVDNTGADGEKQSYAQKYKKQCIKFTKQRVLNRYSLNLFGQLVMTSADKYTKRHNVLTAP
jgi:hypothetical protein